MGAHLRTVHVLIRRLDGRRVPRSYGAGETIAHRGQQRAE
jgi:hypothetical protein